jgi:cation transport ATPase
LKKKKKSEKKKNRRAPKCQNRYFINARKKILKGPLFFLTKYYLLIILIQKPYNRDPNLGTQEFLTYNIINDTEKFFYSNNIYDIIDCFLSRPMYCWAGFPFHMDQLKWSRRAGDCNTVFILSTKKTILAYIWGICLCFLNYYYYYFSFFV